MAIIRYTKDAKKVYGVGIVGKGQYTSGTGVKGKHTKMYNVWNSMLKRCYDSKIHILNSSYKDCTVCDSWLNFQEFGEWFTKNYIEDYQLDKDILIKGNKIYSPETCCFVPQEINLLLGNRKKARGIYPIGVTKQRNKFSAHVKVRNKQIHCGNFDTVDDAFLCYKTIKELDIKARAEEFKSIISDNVYIALINYTIEKED